MKRLSVHVFVFIYIYIYIYIYSSHVLQTRLVDSFGYSYTQKSNARTSVIYWNCSVRNKKTYCRATVIQRGTTYTKGVLPHICQPQPGQALASKISKVVKQSSTSRVFDSAAKIVEEV